MADTHSKLGEELLIAVIKGEKDRVEYLLEKKADANYRDVQGQFPLLLASCRGSKKIVQLLIDGGAEINLVGNYGMTALSLASERGHHEIVEILVDKGAIIDHPVVDERTPLMLAAQNGHTETVRVLLSKNANTDLVEGRDERTALMIASSFGRTEVVDMLLTKVGTPNNKDGNNITSLMLASESGHTDTVDLLLTKGAQADLRNSNGYTALMLASSNGHDKVVEKLLEMGGAKIDLRTSHGHTALILATKKGHTRVVEVLLNHNAEVDLRLHESRETALMIASKDCNIEIVELLLRGETESQEVLQSSNKQGGNVIKKRSRSADVNLTDTRGNTALILASSSGNVKLVEILIHHGANVNPKDVETTPLYLATKHGYTDIVEVLLINGTNPNQHTFKVPPLILATVCEYTEIIKVLLKYKAEVDVTYGRTMPVTPLMHAIVAGHRDLVQLLCDHGADIHFKATRKANFIRSDITSFTSEDVANAMGDHQIVDIVLSTSQKKPNEDPGTATPTSQQQNPVSNHKFLNQVVRLVKKEYESVRPSIQFSRSFNLPPNLNEPYSNLSDSLPEVSHLPSVDNQGVAKPLKCEGLSTSSVYKVLVSVASNWELIGVLLGVGDGALKTIEADNGDSNKRLLEMVRVWLNMTEPPPTWKDLADAVEQLGNQKLSKEILEKDKAHSDS